MIRSIISRDTCITYHVTNVQHGSACSCTTLNYCTTWLVFFKYNNIQLQYVYQIWCLYHNINNRLSVVCQGPIIGWWSARWNSTGERSIYRSRSKI